MSESRIPPKSVPQNPALSEAVNNDIANRLKDKDCAKLFGGVDKALEALQALSSLKISFEDLGEYRNIGGTPRGPWVGTEAQSGTNEIVINTSGGYPTGGYAKANDGMPLGFGKGMSHTAYQSSVIIHELVHIRNPKAFGKNENDLGDAKKSKKNQEKVLKNCF